MDRNSIEKIAQNKEDQMLLAKLWDKIQSGMRRNIPAFTSFLSPREQEMARYLFGQSNQLRFYGGYGNAERKMLIYTPEYLDEDWVEGEDSPIVCLRCTYYEQDELTHRDLLGALMGSGIARETVGDICIDIGSCDLFVTQDICAYLLQNFTQAGRTKINLMRIPLVQAHIPQAQVKVIKDTVASLRLDGIVSSGFRISRGLAAQHIAAGKVQLDGLPCEKPDKQVLEGAKISLRGMGKMLLAQVNGQTKKGRISIQIHRYL